MFKGYTIIETLHRGVKSNIYRANSIGTNEKVIIKSLANQFPKPLEIGRLQHEFQLLQFLKIKGVPSAVSFEKSDNYYGIVLKDENGMSAKEHFKNQTPDLKKFLEFAVHLCQIISGIHSKQIIHKDIKPANILISATTEEVQLIDFGLAVRLLSGTQESSTKVILEGSLPYISPEQTGRMNRPVDYRSDLYSLGITFFELLTGRFPFTAGHPLEWVHAHLAQAAPDPRTFLPDLPEAVALIILKLLSKTSEDRYQSAYNLQKDLENCLKQWSEKMNIVTFELAATDTFGLFMLPSKLYGREKQLSQLSHILNQVIKWQNSQLIMVSGYSGIGKTAFVQEARKQITIAKGNFITGKFDQLNKGIPFSGFILAFSELARQLLTEKEETLLSIKSQLLEALGDNAQIVNQLVPAFELIIGVHPAPPLLLPEETSNRFLQTLKTFVKTVARPDCPLTIFIDDLQWADVASLSLLELLASDNDLKRLCLIGSYRSNEVDFAHPLMQCINKVKEYMPFHEIQLNNLQEDDICMLLSDAFKRTHEETTALAQLLLAKTEGNPFFLMQSLGSLYNEGIIVFDSNKGKWNWDQTLLSSLNISDNVVELMVSKIQKLSSNAQQILKLAACVGNDFSLDLLTGITDAELVLSLKQSLEQGLVSSLDENYVLLSDAQQFQANFYAAKKGQAADAKFKFLHDRVQQAAYLMLTDDERKKTHLLIGQKLNSNTDENQRAEQIFTICNQLNKAVELITKDADRLELSTINFTASKKALEATAFSHALEYSAIGISLLPSNAVNDDYSLWQGLYLINAQCNYITGNIQAAEKEYTQLLRHSQCRMDKLIVFRAMVDMYSSGGNQVKVIETVRSALSLFGIKMPSGSLKSKLRIMASIAEIKWRLRNKTKENLVHAPRCKNEDHIKLAELLLEAGPSVFLSSQDLFAWMVLFEVRYALRLGNTPSTALGLTGYGMIMNTAFGDLDLCFKMAGIGEALNKEFGNPFPYHKLRFVKLNFISHFKDDPNSILEEFFPLAKMALAAGDYLYLGLNYYDIVIFRLSLGHPLKDIFEQSGLHLKQLRLLNNNYGYDLLLCRYQAVLSLKGEALLPWDSLSPEVNFDEKNASLKETKSFTNLMLLHISIFQTHYILNQHNENIFHKIEEATKYKEFINNTFNYADFALYQSLSSFKIFKSQNKPGQNKLKKIIRDHLKTLKGFISNGGHFYECHWLLLSGLQHLLNNNSKKALEIFDTLVSKSDQRNLTHISAITKELVGREYHERNQEKIASVYLKESAYDYNRWGALEKVKLMIRQYPEAGLQKEYGFSEINLNSETQTSETRHGLDLSSLMKSASAISEEIVLNKLLPSMISIVVENAGAQIGYLVLDDHNALVLKVKRNGSHPDAELMHDMPVSESMEVAQTVIQYVHRTQEIVILENAFTDSRFKNDEHIQKNKLKSILCVPILHKDVFRGALYLENNLMTHAFSEERVNVMKILSSQIAISLDNALLYSNLADALDKQVTLTEAYSRFTPKEYLRFLGHASILDVKLGDYRIETMTVLFSDIRSYTTIAEQFSAEENFKFLSSYLEKMTGIVTSNNGMVNQLLGDGILAFFAKSDDALRAAVEMQKALQNYKVARKNREPITIKTGIGLHSGEVIIGIMGNAQSMDTGIVSDTVNAAARIEGLTKHFGVNILLSENVVKQLQSDTCEQFRYIARVRMKGKNIDIGIYECFEGDHADMKIKKSESLKDYHSALGLYSTRQFHNASIQFSQLLQKNNMDSVLLYYQNKSNSMINTVVPDDWTATEIMEIK